MKNYSLTSALSLILMCLIGMYIGLSFKKTPISYPSEGIVLLEQSGDYVSIQRNYTRNNGSKWSVKLGCDQSEVWGQGNTLSEAAINAKTKTDCFKRHCEDCIGEK